jgi:hypothetical protein
LFIGRAFSNFTALQKDRKLEFAKKFQKSGKGGEELDPLRALLLAGTLSANRIRASAAIFCDPWRQQAVISFWGNSGLQ